LEDDILRRYLGVIRRWWWLLLLGIVIPMAVSYHFESNYQPLYQAKVTLMVGTTIQSSEPDQRLISMSNTLARAYAELVRRRPITQAVIERLDYHVSPEALATQITTRVRTEAQLLEIIVTDLNPLSAPLIANALADELVRQSPGSRQDAAQREFIGGQLEELQSKIEKVEASLMERTGALADLSSAAEIADAEERIGALESVHVRYQSAYASLLQSMMSDQGPNILSIVEPASPYGKPLPRKTVLIVGLAGLAGLAVAIGGVLLTEYADDRLHWEGTHQKSVLGLPVLGAIARISGDDSPLVFKTRPGSPEAESIRNIRTSIQLCDVSHPVRVLLATSPNPDDGKSMMIANLALSIAAMGQKTILIDADFRKRQLHRFFQISDGRGLVDALSDDDADPLAAVQETSVPNLSLLRAGRPPLDSASLLASARFSELLALIKDRFEWVLMDSPPLLALPDAAILAGKVDGTLILIDAETARKRTLLRAKSALTAQGRDNLLGVVFNRVRSSHKHDHDYYY